MNSTFQSIPVRLVLNLAKRTDRLEAFRAMAENLPFSVERFEAVEPGPFSGAAGNLHTFARAVEHGLSLDARRMLIFEDDASPRPGARALLHGVESELFALGESWDMYMLGLGAAKPKEITSISSRTVKVERCGGTQAVILSRSGMMKIHDLGIETLEDAAGTIQRTRKMPDVYLTTLLRTYLHVPLLFDQAPGYSDISQMRTNPQAGLDRFESETLLPAASGA